jgi:flagellar protein FliO/FliZ
MTPAAVTGMAATPSIGGAVLNLLLVLGLILALAWVVRRFKGGRGAPGQGQLRIRASLSLTLKERIVLVDAAGEHLLLGVSPTGITCLHRYATPPAEIAPDAQFSFASLLRRQVPGVGSDDAR